MADEKPDAVRSWSDTRDGYYRKRDVDVIAAGDALASEVVRLQSALRDEARCVQCGKHPAEHGDECHGIYTNARVAEIESAAAEHLHFVSDEGTGDVCHRMRLAGAELTLLRARCAELEAAAQAALDELTCSDSDVFGDDIGTTHRCGRCDADVDRIALVRKQLRAALERKPDGD